jgi:hypothetical protein
MIDCIADSTGTRCVNCGWAWKRGGPFPRRNCNVQPDLAPAAERLGVTLANAYHYAGALLRWSAAGFPTRTPEEVETIVAVCQACDRYAGQRCRECGCRITAKGPAIRNKAAMATEACPLQKWR